MIKFVLVILVLARFSLTMRHSHVSSVQQQLHNDDEDEAFCDDGKQLLAVDWDGSPKNYTCNKPKKLLPVISVKHIEECEYVPESHAPQHFCMDKKVNYQHILPTHEGHRPVWPVYGEYVFLPPQRWLHSVEVRLV